ncbi:hypothetical protein [Streptomyces sp. NPDC095613]|uniref:hypothetical protein n=1 Tax=Streptomyces sp. NPDC095613 TaxID=3155540 RepID=UPI00332C251E
MTVLPSSGRTRRAVLTVALCVGLAGPAAGCAEEVDPDKGTNGVGKLTAAEIQRKAQTAVAGADAVRLSGSLVSKGQTYKLNMKLKENGGLGSVTSKSSTFQLLRIGETLYLKADAGFWSHADGDEGEGSGGSGGSGGKDADASAAGKLSDKYVKVPQDDPSYKQLSGFTDMEVLLGGLLTLHGELTKGDRDTLGGVRTIKVNGAKGSGGTLDVSLEGTPYPLQLQRAGGAGTVTLADWNKDFELEEPTKSQTVDYGSRLPSSDERR